MVGTMTRRRKHRGSVKRTTRSQRLKNVQRLIARQKKLLFSVAGIGASGFSDISVAHDTYLHEKP